MRADPKKTKRKENSSKALEREKSKNLKLVKMTNQLNIAVNLRTLKTVFGFGNKRLATFMESYLALMSEVQDSRLTVPEAVEEAKEITGIDIVKMLDNL